MPPFSSSFQSVDVDNDFRGSNMAGLTTTTTGFTSMLLQSIVTSKSKMEEWAQHEKAKADALAESYRQNLMEQQAMIDSKSTELLAVQMERGMKIDINNSNPEEDNTEDNLASRKQALEEQMTNMQIEIMKLQAEKENRERRVQGKLRKVSTIICVVL